MQINLDDYGFKLTNYDCDIHIKNNLTEENFDPFLSNTSKVEMSGINFISYEENQVFRITDQIKLLSNNSNNFIYPKVLFIYNPRNVTFSMTEKNFSPYTCFKLGLRLPPEYSCFDENDLSLLGQFKRDRVIGSYEWFIEYNSENNNAKLIIGISPFEYNNTKYIENNLKKINSVSIPNNNYYYWNIEFTQVYMIDKNNKRDIIDIRIASLEPSLNVIKGPIEYGKIINETIFEELINNKKCFSETVFNEDIIIVFYCNNTLEIKDYIKNKFLNIIFLDRILGEEFILTYNDLFMEKNNKLFFLVVFDIRKSKNTWIFGKPFLNKYFFSYNYDKKILSYYSNNVKNKEIINNKNYNKIILIIIIIGLAIIFCVLGFLLAKYLYKIKYKKDATELEDDLKYKGVKEINDEEGLTK